MTVSCCQQTQLMLSCSDQSSKLPSPSCASWCFLIAPTPQSVNCFLDSDSSSTAALKTHAGRHPRICHYKLLPGDLLGDKWNLCEVNWCEPVNLSVSLEPLPWITSWLTGGWVFCHMWVGISDILLTEWGDVGVCLFLEEGPFDLCFRCFNLKHFCLSLYSSYT